MEATSSRGGATACSADAASTTGASTGISDSGRGHARHDGGQPWSCSSDGASGPSSAQHDGRASSMITCAADANPLVVAMTQRTDISRSIETTRNMLSGHAMALAIGARATTASTQSAGD